jgi:hypothetical protein
MLYERGKAFEYGHSAATIVIILSIVAGIVICALEWGGLL